MLLFFTLLLIADMLELFLIENIIKTRNIDFRKIISRDDTKIPDKILALLDTYITAERKPDREITYLLYDQKTKRSITLTDNRGLKKDGSLYCDFVTVNDACFWQIQFNACSLNRQILLKVIIELLDKSRVDMIFLQSVMLPLFPACKFAKV